MNVLIRILLTTKLCIATAICGLVILLFSKNIAANDGQITRGLDQQPKQKIVYLVSDLNIPFWSTMGRGVNHVAERLGYELIVYSSNNDKKRELELLIKAIRQKVTAIILSPISSSSSVTLLKLAKNAKIPVVIADVGSDGGEYVSYISSDNKQGAYDIGLLLANEMIQHGWADGHVGIVAIPQKRANGQARTAGFMQAMVEKGVEKVGIRQQVTFSYQETYLLTQAFIDKYPDLHGLWLQGSDRYQAALDAIDDGGKKGEILLICFDAEPAFLNLIPQGVILGAAMQQPYLMGQEAMMEMHQHLTSGRVSQHVELPILTVSAGNIEEKLEYIRKNVLGLKAAHRNVKN